MKTTLIKNCTLIDGSGKLRINSDVAICGDRIVGVGQSLHKSGIDTTIDARGMILSPGFIDTHSHSDISILASPEAVSKISQGITTDVIGNCGLSVFPISDNNRDHISSLYKNYNVDISWSDLKGYFIELMRREPSINIATLCGHNTLRSSILGYKDTSISENELQLMKESLYTSLKNGAKGISTGLLYTPGKFANFDEIAQLLSIVTEFNGVYSTHIRSEGDCLIESINEAIELSKYAKLNKLHISHIKASQARNWSKLDTVFKILEKETNENFRITADRYPYTESMTQLSIILPEPYDSMPDSQIECELKDKTKFAGLLNKLAEYDNDRWDKIRLVNTQFKPLIPHIGKMFSDISKALCKPAYMICAESIQADSTGSMAAFSGMSKTNLNKILSKKFICCGTDESARPVDYSIGKSHPRGFGSMVRFINMQSILGVPLEESIRRITSMPASIFNLVGRGLIKPGYFADLVLFDREELLSMADFNAPHTLSKGISTVWVNGHIAFQNEIISQVRKGRVL